jgi:predicted nucleotidyltransferase component of viral defense system
MVLTSTEKTRHEAYLIRLFTEIVDNPYLAQEAFFKGGTCARWLGWLDRFSVDLDFDLSEKADFSRVDKELRKIFQRLDFEIKDSSQKEMQFFLKYPAPDNQRNTLKLELLRQGFQSNQYGAFYLELAGRSAICQTSETMFAHKLVAPLDRYQKHGTIAGRDIYDIHHFFMKDMKYSSDVIVERRGLTVLEHLTELLTFIQEKVTQRKLDEDLNILLEPEHFNRVRKFLKKEVERFIDNEIKKESK